MEGAEPKGNIPFQFGLLGFLQALRGKRENPVSKYTQIRTISAFKWELKALSMQDAFPQGYQVKNCFKSKDRSSVL